MRAINVLLILASPYLGAQTKTGTAARQDSKPAVTATGKPGVHIGKHQMGETLAQWLAI